MTTSTFVVTQPGVVPDLPEDLYHSDPVPGGSLSSGGARTLLEPGGPARFAWERANPRTTSTDAFDLGHAVHTMALGSGPEIAVVDAPDWRPKVAKEAKAKAYAEGKTPLLEKDYLRARAMVAALKQHVTAGALLWADGPAEQSLFWADKATGMWCRARHDKAIRDRNGRLIIVDLKTCERGDDRSAGKSTGSYGYHQQDQWYRRGAVACGLDDDPGFVFVFVEKQPPYLVNVVQLTPDDVEVGRRRNDAALRLYAECTRTGTWPGYGDEIAEISLPAYYPRQEF